MGKHTRIRCLPWSVKSEYIGDVVSEVTEVEGRSVELALCNLQLFFNEKAKNVASLGKEELFNVERYLQCQDHASMRQKYPTGSTAKIMRLRSARILPITLTLKISPCSWRNGLSL